MAVGWEQSRLIAHTPTGRAWQGLPVRRRHPVWAFAIAASVVAILFVGLLLARGAPRPLPQMAAQQLASPIGIRTVRLGDGSVVTLDAGTRLELRFTAGERRIVLGEGRARFAVAEDRARPFVVAAADREVVTTDALFDVGCASGQLMVALLRGGLAVRTVGPDARPQLVTQLQAGEAVQLARGAAQASPQPAAPASLAWTSGMIDFNGTPLRDVVATANRYSTRQLLLADSSLSDLKVTGGFKLGDTASLAASLAAAFDLEVVATGDGSLTLRRRR